MNDSESIKITEFDNLVNKNQLQMIKAAIPYISANEQKILSIVVKTRELMNTLNLFREDESGTIGICSVESERSTPPDMLHAMREFAEEPERDMIDLVLNFYQASNLYQSYIGDGNPAPASPFSSGTSTMDLLKNMLDPEQQSMLDTYQMLFQTMGQT